MTYVANGRFQCHGKDHGRDYFTIEAQGFAFAREILIYNDPEICAILVYCHMIILVYQKKYNCILYNYLDLLFFNI